MIQIITISDIIEFKAISVNVFTPKKLDPFILEAQQFDLKKLLGEALYLDFMKDFTASPMLAKYNDLFYGCEFTYHNQLIRHEGIKTTLCYLSYARYLLNSNVDATAFGTVHKKEEYSEQVDDKTINRIYNQAYAGAIEYWSDVKKYLDVSTISLWHKCFENKKITTNRISGVSADEFNYPYNFNHRHGRRRYRDEY